MLWRIYLREEHRDAVTQWTRDTKPHHYSIQSFTGTKPTKDWIDWCCKQISHDVITLITGRLGGLIGSALDHGSLQSEFESRRGHILRVFHLWLRFITFGGRSAHLAYRVHKSGRKTPIIIVTLITNLYLTIGLFVVGIFQYVLFSSIVQMLSISSHTFPVFLQPLSVDLIISFIRNDCG